MTPLEASSILATLVGLICSWRDERSRTATNKYEDFMIWLEHHNFNKLRSHILESKGLQHSLNELLRQDIAQLDQKLDALSSAISSISAKIDTLSAIGNELHADGDGLSVQAVGILQYFDQIEASRMIVFDRPATCVFLPTGDSITVSEPRFMETDVDSLAQYGFIELVDHNPSGNPIFALTRSGAKVAQAMQINPDDSITLRRKNS